MTIELSTSQPNRWPIQTKSSLMLKAMATQNNCLHKNLLVNNQWRAVDSIKHCEQRLHQLTYFFEKEVNSHLHIWIWFCDLKIRFWGLEIKHRKAHNLCNKCAFSSIILSQLRRPIEPDFSQVSYFMHICWDTSSEKTGLWQLPIVSSVFNTSLIKV